LLVVTYRPEHDHGWGNRSQVSVLRVDPLTSKHAHALVGAMLGEHPSVLALRQQLADWTGGVPLFLEESVRALVETGTLHGEPGDFEMRAPSTTLRLPPRVQGVVAARIDRLTPSQKRLLQAAAVIGPEGPASLLVDVLRADPDDIGDDLAGVHRTELLYERRHGRERYFAFKHAIVQDVAYSSLPRARRRMWHNRVVEAIGSRNGDQLGDDIVRLAHHAMLAERWREAAELHGRAGALALDRCAYREAAALLERAIERQQRLPADADREIDLRLQLRPALHAMSDFDRMFAHLDRAESLAVENGDDRRQLLIVMHRSYLLDTRGHVAAAVAAAKRAANLAERIGEPMLIAEARLVMAQCLTFAGDPRRVVALIEQDQEVRAAAPLQERLGMAGTRPIFALVWMSIASATLGGFEAAERHLDAADNVAAEVDRPIDFAVAGLGRGVLELRRGRFEKAALVLDAARELCEEAGMPLIGKWIEPVLAEALALTGRVGEARSLLDRTYQAGQVHDVPLWQAGAALGYARAALAEGDGPAARSAAAHAAALADTWEYREMYAVALRLGASAAALEGDVEQAEAQARQAAKAARAIGARPEHARCGLVLADLLRGAGRIPEARRHADAVLEECEQLGLRDPVGDDLARWRGRTSEGAIVTSGGARS
jgi:tetratricopeptide (TPR) repeat protein